MKFSVLTCEHPPIWAPTRRRSHGSLGMLAHRCPWRSIQTGRSTTPSLETEAHCLPSRPFKSRRPNDGPVQKATPRFVEGCECTGERCGWNRSNQRNLRTIPTSLLAENGRRQRLQPSKSNTRLHRTKLLADTTHRRWRVFLHGGDDVV